MEEEERRLARVASRRTNRLTRIKSVGKAPVRSTPLPITTRYMLHGSLHIEPIMIPPKQPNNMEIIQGSLDSTRSGGVLRDSEVLGIEGGFTTEEADRGYF
ncbi:hypothetical protein Hypma_001401 [Hypsizygus marmoreus]|uniref:Uncharacterized protein n=1 Tax=Hypsizygus marmoreus TaxID=39966 RepID=A0A369K632_HYPMA|nr:hypothetical protein Hypma_001401 [Hypsizygus marmoreus]